MKGEKDALWEKVKHPGAPSGSLEGDMGHAGKGGMVSTSIPNHNVQAEPAGESKAPKQIGHDAKDPSMEKVAGGDLPAEKGGASKSAKKDAYAGEMGSGKDKLSPMAQKVGKPRRGY